MGLIWILRMTSSELYAFFSFSEFSGKGKLEQMRQPSDYFGQMSHFLL